MLYRATNVRLENTEIKGNKHGVEVAESSNIILVISSLIGNTWFGIVSMDSENIVISNNTIANNSFHGINIMGRAVIKHAPIEYTIFGYNLRVYPREFWYLQQRTSAGDTSFPKMRSKITQMRVFFSVIQRQILSKRISLQPTVEMVYF